MEGKIALIKEELLEVHRLLEKRTQDSYGIVPTLGGGLWFQGNENELYLKTHFPHTLVISRIAFQEKRKGIGTELLHVLKAYAKEKGFKKLMIESTMTKEINRFCEKHGLEKIEYQGTWFEGEFYGNYQIEL